MKIERRQESDGNEIMLVPTTVQDFIVTIIVLAVAGLLLYPKLLPIIFPSIKNGLYSGTLGCEIKHIKSGFNFFNLYPEQKFGVDSFPAKKNQSVIINYEADIKTGVLTVTLYKLNSPYSKKIKEIQVISSSKNNISIPVTEDGLYSIYIHGSYSAMTDSGEKKRIADNYDIKYIVSWNLL